MDGELLFELHGPDGHVWRLYENGRADGFPAGTIIVNKAKPLLDSLRGCTQSPVSLLYQAQQEAQIKLTSGRGE